ncbi:hypothetical protein ROJ8625_01948 [Roseivivax jejudonensis]|uniref:Oxidoreductase probably involved in sulfite reduction n=1 Tax=Roseivivax jejudonensis TaxID=1529041 RepID=A0A1X6Z5T0_9RHOB|nr:DUF934 domain-containing protein [Roseivivax jejudonensis]SLN41076.1 hypothetical protein ROJ8625_01948 [Roseivivax jejudonensis]
MSVIVTDAGFGPDDFDGPWAALDEGGRAIDLPSDTDPAALAALPDDVEAVRIDFPSFSDGRGFTLARLLRLRGYRGRLRARGHVIADQFAMIRRAGFDEVEISDALAARQPEDQWLFRANWTAHDYQARLRG